MGQVILHILLVSTTWVARQTDSAYSGLVVDSNNGTNCSLLDKLNCLWIGNKLMMGP